MFQVEVEELKIEFPFGDCERYMISMLGAHQILHDLDCLKKSQAPQKKEHYGDVLGSPRCRKRGDARGLGRYRS